MGVSLVGIRNWVSRPPNERDVKAGFSLKKERSTSSYPGRLRLRIPNVSIALSPTSF